jgi:penicillin-binding protein 1A
MHLTRCLMPPQCCKELDRAVGTLFLLKRVESVLSKDLIFEIFLNDVYLGRGATGVADAAANYFGKSPGDLSPDEVAFIVTRARTPFRGRNGDADIERRNFALERMLRNGVINEAQAVFAGKQPLMLRQWPDSQTKPASTDGNQSAQ